MAETPDTDHFGLTRVGEGEQLSKNGFAALDLDRVTLDDLLHALTQHTHSAEPRLANPAGAPSLIGRPTGGTLPPNTTLYYRIAYIDKWGLETAGSSEASITTSGALPSPTAISATLETSGGTLGTGLYAYVATYATASGGETVPGPRTEVRIEGEQSTGATNRLRIVLPDRPPGAAMTRIYRSRPGQTQYYFLFETDEMSFYDDGSMVEDSTVTIPGFNSTNSANSVEVIVPGGALPPGVHGWKLYRSVTPGTYSGFNLVHVVVEGTTETSNDIRTSWMDVGAALQRGEPRQISATVSGGAAVNLAQVGGRFPLEATPRGARTWDPFLAGALTIGREYARMYAPFPISPTSISATFLAAPVTTATGAQVALRLVDSVGNYVSLSTDGSNGNHYRVRFPITDSGTFEAEKGDRSATGVVPIITDLTASNGQAVELNDINEHVEFNIGTLDPGRYVANANMRNTVASEAPQDVTVTVLNADTSAILGESVLTVAKAVDDAYAEFGNVTFRTPGEIPIKIRVSKATATAATYLIDQFRYVAELGTLAAGDITLVAEVGDIPDQDYDPPIYGAEPHWEWEQTHLLLDPASPSGAINFFASDEVAEAYTITVDQPWLTVDLAAGNAATGVVTVTADFASLNPGDRLTGTVTIAGTLHTAATIPVIALKAPAVTGSDVNVSVAY